jgi:hypothetical protein
VDAVFDRCLKASGAEKEVRDQLERCRRDPDPEQCLEDAPEK